MIPNDSKNYQIPGSLISSDFGEVNVKRTGNVVNVSFTILMEPEGDESLGYQTGVAIDVSASMKSVFGKALQGKIPQEVLDEYKQKGYFKRKIVDGREVLALDKVGERDAINKGFLTQSANLIEPVARSFIEYLADGLDEDGGTTVIYWAGGVNGDDIEVLGDIMASECKSLELSGPSRIGFGNGTKLLPAIRYFSERFKNAKRGIYLFITDGSIDDFVLVKQFSIALAAQIYSNNRFPLKFVLIGLGDRINIEQMAELDDLDVGVPVDLWDHKIASEMKDLSEIFAEVVDENSIVAPSGEILDSNGKVIKNFAAGLPARINFDIDAANAFFELKCGGQVIKQVLSIGNS